jgi:predicted DNA-binding WGR domain protein
MQQGFDGKFDYQKRRELRREYERWLASIDTDYLVTLSFSQSTRIASARQMLRHWFVRIDNYYIGRTWSRVGSAERTFGISFPENMQTSLHYHCLIRLPTRARTEPYEATAATLQRAWYRVAPRGSCDSRGNNGHCRSCPLRREAGC